MTQSYIAASPAAGLLRLARLTRGLSQGRLAASAGVPATMISAYERDRRQPTLPTLFRLLNAAGFDLRLQLVPLDDGADLLAELDETHALESRHGEFDRSQQGVTPPRQGTE
jgi:transcriptional regulator with XRE-family HTH domain